jgi:hypothetical protein
MLYLKNKLQKVLQGITFAAIVGFYSWAFASAVAGEIITF